MGSLRKHYVETSTGQVHSRYLSAAQSNTHPPLVCLHPAPSSGLYFSNLMPLINADRLVVAPDLPGYGGSDPLGFAPSVEDYAKATAEFIMNSGLETPLDILGFHSGCLVGLELSLQRPDLVHHIVLCDVPYFTAGQRPVLRKKAAQPAEFTSELDSLAKAWRFNVDTRIDDVPLPRCIELLAEQLRAGSDDFRLFDAVFRYDCETRFAAQISAVSVIATQSGLLDATRAAAGALPNVELVEALDIQSAVFESSAERIAEILTSLLDR